MPTDWIDWHRRYDESSSQRFRLETIRRRIAEALDEGRPGPINVLSLCAGDGRDLVGALQNHLRRNDVRATLVELEPQLVAMGQRSVDLAALSAERIKFLTGDAGDWRTYAGLVPADLILCCGVFGNVSAADIQNTVANLPLLCSDGATVIWTRSARVPDMTPQVRGWFKESGFAELGFEVPTGSQSAVGVARLVERSSTTRFAGGRLFSFID